MVGVGAGHAGRAGLGRPGRPGGACPRGSSGSPTKRWPARFGVSGSQPSCQDPGGPGGKPQRSAAGWRGCQPAVCGGWGPRHPHAHAGVGARPCLWVLCQALCNSAWLRCVSPDLPYRAAEIQVRRCTMKQRLEAGKSPLTLQSNTRYGFVFHIVLLPFLWSQGTPCEGGLLGWSRAYL